MLSPAFCPFRSIPYFSWGPLIAVSTAMESAGSWHRCEPREKIPRGTGPRKSPYRMTAADRSRLDFDLFHGWFADVSHAGATVSRLERRVASVWSRNWQVVLFARKVSAWSRLGGRYSAVREREHLRLL